MGQNIKAKVMQEQRNWVCTHNGSNKFEIKHAIGKFGYTVDIKSETCSCGLWEQRGILCCHSISAIYFAMDKPERYFIHWYHVDMIKKTYEHTLEPINSELLWERTPYHTLEPLRNRRMTERTKKQRHKEDNEVRSKLSKHGLVITCSRGNGVGDNKPTCHGIRVHPLHLIVYFILFYCLKLRCH